MVKENVRATVRRVKDGSFVEKRIQEYKSGGENLKRLMKELEVTRSNSFLWNVSAQ